jgi:hypothetical protein
MWYQGSKTPVGPGGMMVSSDGNEGATFRANGPMGQLTEEEQAELEGMTEAERQQWLEDKFGAAPGAGPAGMARGGDIEGEVVEVAADSLTVKLESGSQTFYTDEKTVVAYTKGAGELAAGSTVMLFAGPSSDGVATATLVVVK